MVQDLFDFGAISQKDPATEDLKRACEYALYLVMKDAANNACINFFNTDSQQPNVASSFFAR